MSYNLNVKSSPAMDVALRIISYEPQFSGVLKNKLLKKGFNSEQITQALRQLEELEMLDDERLAKIYAGDLMRVKLYGPAIVRGKLYEKGVERNIAENAIKLALEDNGGEVEVCRKIELADCPVAPFAVNYYFVAAFSVALFMGLYKTV